MIAHAAAGLHYAGGGQVIEVHQQVRGQAIEVAGFIWQEGQHAGQAQGFRADFHAVAGFKVKRDKQPGFGPGFAGLRPRTGLFGVVERGGAFQFAA